MGLDVALALVALLNFEVRLAAVAHTLELQLRSYFES